MRLEKLRALVRRLKERVMGASEFRDIAAKHGVKGDELERTQLPWFNQDPVEFLVGTKHTGFAQEVYARVAAGLLRMPVAYVAHPVRAATPAEAVMNIGAAQRWLSWLVAETPDVAYIAPWLQLVRILGTDDQAHERGLQQMEAVVTRCDSLVLVGGRISGGMAREAMAARAAGVEVIDMTELGPEPPEGR